LQLLFLVKKNCLFFFIRLHPGLPVFVEIVVSTLKKDDKPQDIRTYKYYATCVRNTAPVLKYTHKLATIKEEKLNLQYFSLNVLLITDTSTGSTLMELGSIHNRVRYLTLLHTVTGLRATQPILRGSCSTFPAVKGNCSHDPSAVDTSPFRSEFLCSSSANIRRKLHSTSSTATETTYVRHHRKL
jgi:hypothetical protein